MNFMPCTMDDHGCTHRDVHFATLLALCVRHLAQQHAQQIAEQQGARIAELHAKLAVQQQVETMKAFTVWERFHFHTSF